MSSTCDQTVVLDYDEHFVHVRFTHDAWNSVTYLFQTYQQLQLQILSCSADFHLFLQTRAHLLEYKLYQQQQQNVQLQSDFVQLEAEMMKLKTLYDTNISSLEAISQQRDDVVLECERLRNAMDDAYDNLLTVVSVFNFCDSSVPLVTTTTPISPQIPTPATTMTSSTATLSTHVTTEVQNESDHHALNKAEGLSVLLNDTMKLIINQKQQRLKRDQEVQRLTTDLQRSQEINAAHQAEIIHLNGTIEQLRLVTDDLRSSISATKEANAARKAEAMRLRSSMHDMHKLNRSHIEEINSLKTKIEHQRKEFNESYVNLKQELAVSRATTLNQKSTPTIDNDSISASTSTSIPTPKNPDNPVKQDVMAHIDPILLGEWIINHPLVFHSDSISTTKDANEPFRQLRRAFFNLLNRHFHSENHHRKQLQVLLQSKKQVLVLKTRLMHRIKTFLPVHSAILAMCDNKSMHKRQSGPNKQTDTLDKLIELSKMLSQQVNDTVEEGHNELLKSQIHYLCQQHTQQKEIWANNFTRLYGSMRSLLITILEYEGKFLHDIDCQSMRSTITSLDSILVDEGDDCHAYEHKTPE